MEIRFEWDENKNVLNQINHGISFETAKMVFSDPKRYEMFDFEHSLFEERWQTVGMAGWLLLAVIFTEKDDVIRIITAQKASKSKQEEYFYG
ncbi:MAG: BrnT family toxin, partial [Treponema sp.]|nr:BrnT family toxin [Treponema sp.]